MKTFVLSAALLAVAIVMADVGGKTAAAEKSEADLPKGERRWPPVSEIELQKIQAALPDKPQVAPQKPRKLLVFYRTDGYPHASIPEWNKMRAPDVSRQASQER